MKVLYAGVSDGAKVSYLKILHRAPDGLIWDHAVELIGSKARASRHLAELVADGWLLRSPHGWAHNNGERWAEYGPSSPGRR